MSFVMPRLEQAGDAVFWKKVIKRTLLIFFIGLLLNWSPFIKWENDHIVFKQFSNLRIMGVLQRIALCYFFASVIVYYFKHKGAFVVGAILLLFYWILALLAGTPGDPYSLNGWFGNNIDKAIFGEAHLYKGEGVPFDPEGLMSTFAAIVQVIFGYLVGDYIQKKGKNYEMVSALFVTATILTVSGLAWGMVFPINKKIWTSSYTLYTTGLAIYTIATMIYFIEFKQAKGLTDEGVQKYLSPFGWFYEKICKQIPGLPENGSLMYAISMIMMYWAICYWLDKKKIYIKV
jgi:predicted acyltransferase